MSNDTPTLETVIDRAIERALGRVNTSRIGYIETYDPATGEADVQPADMGPYRNELGVRVPFTRAVIPHVPVYFPGGGGTRDTWPVKRGDACLLLHTSNPIATWLVSGGIVDENNDRKRHRAGSAIALVGISDFAHWAPASAGARVVGEGATDVRLSTQNAADPVIRKSDLDGVVASIKADLLALKTHTHTGVQTGGGISGPSTQITGIGGVTAPPGSPNVKVP